MTVNLTRNNCELVRAAWTAFDQMYGTVKPGYDLQPIDASGQGRQQPFEVPEGFKVAQVIEDPTVGGKFVLYKNEKNNVAMLVAGGTCGESDLVGLYSAIQDGGLSQWQSEGVKQTVYQALNSHIDANTQVILAGESKGGSLAQIITHDLVQDRNSGELTRAGLNHLAALSNEQMAIVARASAGIQPGISRVDPNFDPNSSQYADIATHYAAGQLEHPEPGRVNVDSISTTGGDYLNGHGLVHYFSVGLQPPDMNPIRRKFDYLYLHFIYEGGWDHLGKTQGDFNQMPLACRTLGSEELFGMHAQPLLDHIPAEKPVSKPEAAAAAAFTLFDRAQSYLKQSAQILPRGLSRGFLTGASQLANLFKKSSLLAQRKLRETSFDDHMGGPIFATDTSEEFAVKTTHAPSEVPDGLTRTFGRTENGTLFVKDIDANKKGIMYSFGHNQFQVTMIDE